MDNDLHELFLDELADVHNAEQQLIKALPKMATTAESDELRQAFEEHLQETREHVSRLEQVAKSLGESIKRKTCAAMKGLSEETNDIIKEQKIRPLLMLASSPPLKKWNSLRRFFLGRFGDDDTYNGLLFLKRFDYDLAA